MSQSTFLGEIMADRFNGVIRGQKVSLKSNGALWVNGVYKNLNQWDSSSTTWSNQSGQRQKDLDGMSLDDVLRFKGFA